MVYCGNTLFLLKLRMYFRKDDIVSLFLSRMQDRSTYGGKHKKTTIVQL
jgi:hypothetical protein